MRSRSFVIVMSAAVEFTSSSCSSLEPVQPSAEAVIAAPSPCDWPQVFGGPGHAGHACPSLSGMRVIQKLVQDGDTSAIVEQDGFVQIHLPPVVVLGDWVIIPTITGFTDVFHRETERYHVTARKWSPSVQSRDATLPVEPNWTYDTDWQPVDAAVSPFFVTNGYVQQFAVAISGDSVFVPRAHGQMVRLALTTGKVLQAINPFAGTPLDGDARVTVTDAPSVGYDGAVHYGAVAWPTDLDPFVGEDPRGSYLVRVRLDGSVTAVDWSPDNAISIGGGPIASAAVGIASAADLCEYRFGTRGTPLPTGPDSTPPLFGCGVQRPAMNAPFAFTPAGNPVVFSYANNARAAAYLIELNRDTLQPVRSANLRKVHLRYGCGVRLTDFDAFPNCVALTSGGTTNLGVDPDFNHDIHLRTPADIMDNAPVVSPDGSQWWVGSYDGGFSFEGPGGYDARGSLVGFRSSDGGFHASNERYGWEMTPSAIPTAAGNTGWRWVMDEQQFSAGILQVAVNDQDMKPISSGGLTGGVEPQEFVDAHITFGASGDHYGITADGKFYKFNGNSQVVEILDLTRLDGTPIDEDTESVYVAVDQAGHRYVPLGGLIHVIGGGGVLHIPPLLSPAPTARSILGRAAKAAAAARVQDPGPPANR
jgi:hypothetical protein